MPSNCVEAEQNLAEPQVQLSINDSLAYLDAIRTRYESRRDVYHNFLDVMKEFKSNKMDTLNAIENITHLFIDSPDLILAFHLLLPSDSTLRLNIKPPTGDSPDQAFVEILAHAPNGDPYRVPVDLTEEDARKLAVALREQSKRPLLNSVPVTPHAEGINDFAKTLNYMNKVKAKFDDGTGYSAYKRFLALLGYHRELGIVALQEQVEALFKDEPELLEEFNMFVPGIALIEAAAAA